MSFYESIAKYYDDIFPLNQGQVDFILNSTQKSLDKQNVLDVGSGTGTLTLELGEHFSSVMGIEIDAQMLDVAYHKASKRRLNVLFRQRNMLTLQSMNYANVFDLVVCLGNTLVHLENLDQVTTFFEGVQSVLKKEGKLLLQLINYDRILDQDIDHLPTIENERVKFERRYEYLPEKDKINFKTKLTVFDEDKVIENEQLLLPVRKDTLIDLLEKSDFKKIKAYGDFNRGDFSLKNSQPLIIEATA